jgi:hypothetical protein
MCLYYRTTTDNRKTTALGGYFTFLFISLIPVLWMWTLPPSSNGDFYRNRAFPAVWYQFLHTRYINYFVTMLAFLALVPQARELRNRSDLGALSISGLMMQAIVFALVAGSWVCRLKVDDTTPLPSMSIWYQWVGWTTIDNAAFSIVQLILWMMACQLAEPSQPGETAPLLYR